MVKIEEVLPGSPAEELGVESGDWLVAINGEPVRDLVDFMVMIRGEEMELCFRSQSGEDWVVEIEKDIEDDLGFQIEHPDPARCGNNCIFCFVHQLPKGMRSSLYVKDEDFRFSFLYGSYVTLSNIREEDVERIIRQNLTPLYVSVHATDEELRERLLGRPSPAILPLLRRLVDAGIELHTQIVICPGFNDGVALRQTVDDLAALRPGIRSLALVPVGLTEHRERLPRLRLLTADEAAAIVSLVEECQPRYLSEHGSRFLFASDELYLQGGIPIPTVDAYEDFPQIENGVGIVAAFRHEVGEVFAETAPFVPPQVSMVTGRSAQAEIAAFLDRLEPLVGKRPILHVVENRFFGTSVTVTGLITGGDILSQLQGKELGEAVLIPDVMLREGTDQFLDSMSVEELTDRLGVPVLMVESSPWGVIEMLQILAEEQEHG